MDIKPYLTFQGDCTAAITLYQKAFEAEIVEHMLFDELPGDSVPPHMVGKVLQAVLRIGDSLVRLSDCPFQLNAPESERLALAIECSVEETQKAFAVLAEEGRIGIELTETFFSPCHGVVFDKFGVMWNFMAVE